MSEYTKVKDTPSFVSIDYKTAYAEACLKIEGPQDWYKGTGVSAEKHPLSGCVTFGPCVGCGSRNVLVIAAQFNVHPFSGDSYYDYELACLDCERFSTVSYSEN